MEGENFEKLAQEKLMEYRNQQGYPQNVIESHN